jgi:hypothetical protein
MTSTPQEITYSEIREGDRIRVTETYPSGFQNISVGTAHERTNPGSNGDRWFALTDDQLQVVLASSEVPSRVKQVIELVERPRTAPPTERGTIIRITEYYDHVHTVQGSRLAILDTDDEWCAFEFPDDIGCTYINPKDILTWNPVEITDLPHSNN